MYTELESVHTGKNAMKAMQQSHSRCSPLTLPDFEELGQTDAYGQSPARSSLSQGSTGNTDTHTHTQQPLEANGQSIVKVTITLS